MGTVLNQSPNLLSAQRDSRNPSTLVGTGLTGRQAISRSSQHVKSAFKSSTGVLRWRPNAPGQGNRLDVSTLAHSAIPQPQGLFNPDNDKDACGVGFVGELSKRASRKCVTDALKMLARMTHR